MATHPDLPAEQAFVDSAYSRLDELRAAAEERMDEVLGLGKGGTHQAREERDVIVRTSLARIEQLNIGDQSLVFGRIDSDENSFHIGRLGVSGSDLLPLVVDWRAPVAEPFYRATGGDPMDLRRRRHFATDRRRILGIEDEEFSDPDWRDFDQEHGQEPDTHARPGDGSGVAGQSRVTGALLAALERSRSGHMRDIVATVQRQQDEVIRAPLAGILVVQGGPGTGKTAVALHRAAYLLYTHRFPLERQGVLVVGPNQLFLSYIGQVLPSLGESGVALSTVEGLVSSARAVEDDSPSMARLKGSLRMANLVSNAVAQRQRRLPTEALVPFGSKILRLSRRESAHIVEVAKKRRGTHNSRRALVERMCSQILLEKYREGSDDELIREDDDAAERLRKHPAVVQACDRMWPRLSAEELIHDLLGSPVLIDRAAQGMFTKSEIEAMHRPRSSSLESIRWTPSDLPLLDEARPLLGPRDGNPSREQIRTYGHIVVDEAQELSPMQLRLLGRRSMSGSMTIVGDLAQATGPSSPSSWNEVTRHLGSQRKVHLVELDVNYRTPAPIARLAAQVLAEAAPNLRAPRAVREEGIEPQIIKVFPAALVEVAAETAALEADLLGESGTVGVICPESIAEDLARQLGLAGPLSAKKGKARLEDGISVVALRWAKGLEFDVVVVVEPSLIVEEESQGLRALYVALTRPTQKLTIVFSKDLPESLKSAYATASFGEGGQS